LLWGVAWGRTLTSRTFLTGIPGVGKSTVVRKVVERIQKEGIRVGGMTSSDLRSGSARIGFEIRNLMTSEVGVLAHIYQATGPRIGKYRVKSEDLERIGAEAIISAIKDANLIVVDEVGPMELTSSRFKDAVQAALSCGKPLLGTIHRSAQDPLVQAIKRDASVDVIVVTEENRDSLPSILSEQIIAR
jgi:nucleoside-triphosphatase